MSAGVDLAAHTGLSVITLGVAAGPAVRGPENGIATAVVVDGEFYLVDFGIGCTRAAVETGLVGRGLKAAFITHLHSDHVAELPAYLLFNWGRPVEGFETRVPIVGPAADVDRAGGTLAGSAEMLDRLLRAYSYDIDIRQTDEARPPLGDLVEMREIVRRDDVHTVYEDEAVRVSAVRVDHPPVTDAYAFRFDTPYGSVTLSGDTARCPALADLAAGTDVLVHEAVNVDFYREAGFSGPFLEHQKASHTHPADAGAVAQEAGAGHLVLSHLAGRAEPAWWHDQAASAFDGPVTVATSKQVVRVGGPQG